MRGFLTAALRKDLRARLADPMALGLWLGIPLVIGGLISFAFGGSSGPGPKAVVWLTDEDDSALSNLLVGALDNPEMPLTIELLAIDEARARLEAGEGSALVRIPEGFGEAILSEDPTALELVTNPAQSIMPGIVTGMLEALSDAHFYLHRLAGEPLKKMVAGPTEGSFFPDVEMISMTLEINQLVRELQDRLFPPQIQLATEALPEKTSGPGFSLGLTLLPGVLLMGLMFMAQGLADELWAEHESGTLARTLTGPVGAGLLLLSKLLSATLLMTLAAGLGLLLGVVAFDIPLGAVPLALGWCALAGASLFTLFTFLTTLASSRRGANLVGNLVLFPMIMLGGSFFPLSTMPSGMAALGSWTPNGRAVTGLTSILGDGADPLWTGAVALLVMGVLFLWLVRRRLEGSFLR